VHGAGFSPPLRKRMSERTLADEPFRQLASATERLRELLLAGDLASPALRSATLRDSSA